MESKYLWHLDALRPSGHSGGAACLQSYKELWAGDTQTHLRTWGGGVLTEGLRKTTCSETSGRGPPHKRNTQGRRHQSDFSSSSLLCLLFYAHPTRVHSYHKVSMSTKLNSWFLPAGAFEKGFREDGTKIRLLSWSEECSGDLAFPSSKPQGIQFCML